MGQKFSTSKCLVAACAALLVLGAATVRADEIKLAPAVPDRYVVQKGDTLWGIAARFLKDPWRWPDIWRLNREQIKNPHWIYPGDVVVLERGAGGQPQLRLERDTVRVSPTIRATPLDVQAIPSIPPGDIEPYLSRPLFTGPEGLVGAAKIVAGRDQRVVRGVGDVVYAVGIDPKAGDLWEIYRPGRRIVAFENPKLVLGYEQRLLGAAKVERFGDVSTLRITAAREEIIVDDLLVPTPREQIVNYVPHAPDHEVAGRIIALDRDGVEAGRGWLVTIDRGAANGIDVGTVLAISRGGATILDPRPSPDPDQIVIYLDQTKAIQPDRFLNLPEERTGLLFVFRVFDNVSYAILLNTTDPVNVGDSVRNP